MHVLARGEELPGFPAMVTALAGPEPHADRALERRPQVLWPAEYNSQPPKRIGVDTSSLSFRVRLFPPPQATAPNDAAPAPAPTANEYMQNHLLVCCYDVHTGSAMGVALEWQQPPSAERFVDAVCTVYPECGASCMLFVTFRGHEVDQSPYLVSSALLCSDLLRHMSTH